MNILHLIDSGGYYGAEVMIVTLALEQSMLGDQPIICCIVKPGQQEPELVIKARQAGLQAVALTLNGNFWHQGRKIYEYARIRAIDIIHSHGYRPGILLGLQFGNHKVAKVRTLHGWTHATMFSKMAIYSLMDALLLWRQGAVVVVSKTIQELPLLYLVPAAVVSYIANGIPVVPSASKTIEELEDKKWQQLCQDCFVVGTIGRLSAEKAQADMVQAIAMLRHKGIQVALVIIGEGDERQRLVQLSEELGVSDYVHLPGYKDDAASYMPLFDLFCLSSRTEGLPMTVLEAMRQKVPVLSTKVGAIPALLGGGRGYLIEPEVVEALAIALESILAEPQSVKAVTESAYELFNRDYNSVIMANKYRDVYHAVKSGV